MMAKMTTSMAAKAVPVDLRVMCTGITGCNGLIIILKPRVHRV